MAQSVRKGLLDRISLFEQKKVESSLTLPTTRRKVSSKSRNFSSIKDQFDKGQVNNRSPSVTPKTSVGSISDSEVLQLQAEGTVSGETNKTSVKTSVSPSKTPVAQVKTPVQKKPSLNVSNSKTSSKTSPDATTATRSTPVRPAVKSSTGTIKPVATRVSSNSRAVVTKSSTTSFAEKSVTPTRSVSAKTTISSIKSKVTTESKSTLRSSAPSFSKSVAKTSSELTSTAAKNVTSAPICEKFSSSNSKSVSPKTSIGSVDDGNARPTHRLPKQPVKEAEKSPKPILKNSSSPPLTPKTSTGSMENNIKQPATPAKAALIKKIPPSVPPKPKKKLSFPEKLNPDIESATSINATPAPADCFEIQSPTPTKTLVARPQFPDINSNVDNCTNFKAPLTAKKSILKASSHIPPQPPQTVETVETRKTSVKSPPSSRKASSSSNKTDISSRKSSMSSRKSSVQSDASSRKSSVQSVSSRKPSSIGITSRKTSVETSSRKTSSEISSRKTSKPKGFSVENVTPSINNSLLDEKTNKDTPLQSTSIPDIVQDLQEIANNSFLEEEPTTLVESVALHINLTKKNTVTRFELEKPNLQKSFSGLSFKAETLLELSSVQKHEIQITGKNQHSNVKNFIVNETEEDEGEKTDQPLLAIPETATVSDTNTLHGSIEDLPAVEITELTNEDKSSIFECDSIEILAEIGGPASPNNLSVPECLDMEESVVNKIRKDSANSSNGSSHDLSEDSVENVPQALKKISSYMSVESLDGSTSSEYSTDSMHSSSVENVREALATIPTVTVTSDEITQSPKLQEDLNFAEVERFRTMSEDLRHNEPEPESAQVRSSYWTKRSLNNEKIASSREASSSTGVQGGGGGVETPDAHHFAESHSEISSSSITLIGRDNFNSRAYSCNTNLLELMQRPEESKRIFRKSELSRFDDFSTRAANSSTPDDEVYALKRQKHDLEQKLKDEEDEVEDLVSQVQMLEQTKIKLESAISAIKKEHRNELAQKDEEIESIRVNSQKRMKILEDQLEADHEERIQFVREKHDLETKIMTLQQLADTSTMDDDYILKLKKDLKRSKALLKDAQSAMEKSNQESSSKVVIRQLKNQLEDAEFARMAALKFRQNLELELSDVQHQLDDVLRGKSDLEEKLLKMSREKADLSNQISETEEELQEVIRKFRASVAQLSVDQITIQDQVNRISDMEEEHFKLKEHITELNQKIETLDGESVTEAYQSRLELKIKELESKLELEQTTRSRMETQINRLKEGIEKINSECDQLRLKEVQGQEQNRKLQRQIRDLREELADSQQKEVEAQAKKHEIEKQLELSEAEIIMAKNDLKLASKRIEDLQNALNAEIDSDDDSQNSTYEDSESSDDENFMETISMPGIPKIRTTFVRDTMRSRHLETMAEEPEYQLLNNKSTIERRKPCKAHFYS